MAIQRECKATVTQEGLDKIKTELVEFEKDNKDIANLGYIVSRIRLIIESKESILNSIKS